MKKTIDENYFCDQRFTNRALLTPWFSFGFSFGFSFAPFAKPLRPLRSKIPDFNPQIPQQP
jgi:hypothetical protein